MANKNPKTRPLREGAEKFSQQKPRPKTPKDNLKPPPKPQPKK